MPAAPHKKSTASGGAPDNGTADAGRLRGRALIVPTLLLLLGGISYGGIFSANKLAAGVSFPVFAYTFWIALFAGLALLIVGAVAGTLPPVSRRAPPAIPPPRLAGGDAAGAGDRLRRARASGRRCHPCAHSGAGAHVSDVLCHAAGALRGAEPRGIGSRRGRRAADRAARSGPARCRRLGVDAGGAGGRGRGRPAQMLSLLPTGRRRRIRSRSPAASCSLPPPSCYR